MGGRGFKNCVTSFTDDPSLKCCRLEIGRPAPLSECRLMNQTLPSLRIGCREGFDGGLPQTFQLEVTSSTHFPDT